MTNGGVQMRMSWGKRSFDFFLASVLLVLFALPMLAIAGLILLLDGRPVFYCSERMRDCRQSFGMWKFRTMIAGAGEDVAGGPVLDRVTRLGRILRRSRLDELPQLWNILVGDMSFIGPRPPLRRHVEQFPRLYARVLVMRPGLTGLSSLRVHRWEAAMMRRCRTVAEAEALYCRRCIPRKARLDLLYPRQRSLLMDLWILWQTGRIILRAAERGGRFAPLRRRRWAVPVRG